jgi:hypothetical protein
LLTIVVYVQPEADDTPVYDAQDDGAGGDTCEAGENARVDEAVITTAATEAAAIDVSEASRESEIPHQMKV